jgi:hypothetical protein
MNWYLLSAYQAVIMYSNMRLGLEAPKIMFVQMLFLWSRQGNQWPGSSSERSSGKESLPDECSEHKRERYAWQWGLVVALSPL